MDTAMNYPSDEAIWIYSMMSLAIVFTKIAGGLCGDLLLGSKNATIAGMMIITAGAFTLYIPNPGAFFTGIGLLILGTGLYSPNLLARQGKSYFTKPKLLDAGFSMIFLSANIGGFIGAALLTYIVDKFDFATGFIVCGILSLLATVPVLIARNNDVIQKTNRPNPKKHVWLIILFLIIIGLFWSVYNFAASRGEEIRFELNVLGAYDLPKFFWNSISEIILIIIMIAVTIYWSVYYLSRRTKIIISLLSASVAYTILLFVPREVQEYHALILFVYLAFIGIAEIHMTPVIYSLITQYGNSKYLATLLSLSSFPIRILSLLFFGLVGSFLGSGFLAPLLFGIFGMAVLFLIVMFFMNPEDLPEENEAVTKKSSGDLLDN